MLKVKEEREKDEITKTIINRGREYSLPLCFVSSTLFSIFFGDGSG
jgi:hypothetical protein